MVARDHRPLRTVDSVDLKRKLVRTKQSRETVSNFQHDGIFLSGQIRNLPIAYLVAIPNSRGAYDIATEN